MKILDPNAPTEKEIAEMKVRMLKGNLAMDLARNLMTNSNLWRMGKLDDEGMPGPLEQGEVANFCIGLAETIIDKFMSIEGNGGLVS